MRIPVPVVIGSVVVSAALCWWLRTRNMDFLSPAGTVKPLPEFMTDPVKPKVASGPAPEAEMPAPEPPPPPPKSDLDLGDIESAPGLAEYSEYASKGAGHMVSLATELETQGHWDRSLLAWERVLDSCRPSPQERKTAEDAIMRIRPTLTYWNIDPAGDIPILLQMAARKTASQNQKAAMQEAADFLRKDSDHTLLIEARVSSASRKTTAELPVTIYFSSSSKGESKSQGLAPANDAVEHHQLLILSNAYQLLRQELAGLNGIVAPENSSHPGDPKLDFQRQITRLHWFRFAESLNQDSGEQN